MNHQPFRGWLFSEDELTNEQARALDEHLDGCEACRQLESSWKEVEAVIDRSNLLPPNPGFIGRWQIRLVEQQAHQQKLRGWYMIGAAALVSISVLVLILVQLWSMIQSPDVYLVALFDRLMGLISIFFAIRNMVASIYLPGPIYTMIGVVMLFGMISFMSVLWLASYRKIRMARREA
jgi:multidrug efflux pump subunit AcrB